MKPRRMQEKIRVLIVIVIAVLTVLLIFYMNSMLAAARVINYAGTVRGGTQRLVKEELADYPNDTLISRLDAILSELQTGRGEYGLKSLPDDGYNVDLRVQQNAWAELKQWIYKSRGDSGADVSLYSASEEYFTLADNTAKAAESYADEVGAVLQGLEIAEIAALVLLLVMYGMELKGMKQLFLRNSELSELAYVDKATGLSNSLSCAERLGDPRPVPGDVSLACFMFDLNNLKTVNDTLGHREGDLLIQRFAKALRRAAPPHVFAGRNGGDEFIVVWVGMSREDAGAFLKRLGECVDHSNRDNPDCAVSYAKGWAMSDDYPGFTVRELMTKADQAMYENKAEMKSQKSKPE